MVRGGIGDFNGDGKSDILWRNASGSNHIPHLDGPGIFGGPATIVSQDCFLGRSVVERGGCGRLQRRRQGRHPVAQCRRHQLRLADRRQCALGWRGFRWPGGMLPSADVSWSVAGLGDFNGDGKADILWRRPTAPTTSGTSMARWSRRARPHADREPGPAAGRGYELDGRPRSRTSTATARATSCFAAATAPTTSGTSTAPASAPGCFPS